MPGIVARGRRSSGRFHRSGDVPNARSRTPVLRASPGSRGGSCRPDDVFALGGSRRGRWIPRPTHARRLVERTSTSIVIGLTRPHSSGCSTVERSVRVVPRLRLRRTGRRRQRRHDARDHREHRKDGGCRPSVGALASPRFPASAISMRCRRVDGSEVEVPHPRVRLARLSFAKPRTSPRPPWVVGRRESDPVRLRLVAT